MYVVSIIVYGVKGLATKVVCLGFMLLMRKKWKEEWKAREAPAAIQTSEKTASLSNYYGGPPEDLRIKAENLGTLKDRKTVFLLTYQIHPFRTQSSCSQMVRSSTSKLCGCTDSQRSNPSSISSSY